MTSETTDDAATPQHLLPDRSQAHRFHWLVPLVGIALLSFPGCFYGLIVAVDAFLREARGLAFTADGLVGQTVGLAALLAAVVAVPATSIGIGLAVLLWFARKMRPPWPVALAEMVLLAVSAVSVVHFLRWAI